MTRRPAPNLGVLERCFRMSVALGVASFAFADAVMAPVAVVLAVAPAWTAVTGRCPAYASVGMTSVKGRPELLPS